MGGGSKSSSTTSANVPPELSGLMSMTGTNVAGMQHELMFGEDQFWEGRPAEVAGLNPFYDQAFESIPGIGETPEAEAFALEQLMGVSDVAGSIPELSREDLMGSPTIQASQEAFQMITRPTLTNEMTLAGLGRSGAGVNELAMAEASMLAPLFESEIDRRERAIERESGVMLDSARTATGLGAQETGRRVTEAGELREAGGITREAEQDVFDAEYQDFLRRQGLLEQSLFVPLGGFLPSTIGQTTKTSGSK